MPTALITGANSGIGFVTAKTLSSMDFDLILACRSRDKADAACRKIGPRCTPLVMDLSDLSSVQQAAASLVHNQPSIDVFIANAGIMAPPHELTQQGYELQIQTHHLANQLLVQLLEPLLVKSQARIIQISSLSAEKSPATKIEDIRALFSVSEQDYDPMGSYRTSKLAQVMLSQQLHRRLGAQGVLNYSVHPGIVNTAIFYRQMSRLRRAALQPIIWLGYALGKVRTPRRGAETGVWLASAKREDIGPVGGQLYRR